MPNLYGYHASVSLELDAVKNRIRNLVSHWQTDGEWKEAARRTILRRHLPESTVVGRGFIIDRETSSSQIDLLVLNEGKPTLFRDGDLAIVTPDVPAAIVEVKTKVEGAAAWGEIARKLTEHGSFCKRVAKNEPWLGLFAYEGGHNQVENALDAVKQAFKETGIAVDCVMCGYDVFLRFWDSGEYEIGDDAVKDGKRRYWRAYSLDRLSPSYFVSNLVDAVCNVDRYETGYVWFAHPDGKKPRTIAEISIDDSKKARAEQL